jgi:hypothetical protein
MVLNYVLNLLILAQLAQAAQKTAKRDINDNKGNTPFFLQDPYDNQCLGAEGFTECTEKALWMLTKRKGVKTYSLVSLMNPSQHGTCLERKAGFLGLFPTNNVGKGFCSAKGSKRWNFEFVDNKHVKLSSRGMCLVRGKLKYRSTLSVDNCKKEYLPLVYHPTSVHEVGFYLKTADGGCFNGDKFVSCGSGKKGLLWGVGIRYVGGRAQRYFFNFAERSNCIVAKGSKVEKSSCKQSGALKWSLFDGRLAHNYKNCVARLSDDSAAMVSCKIASEHISMDVPATYTPAELEEMVKNQDQLSPEQRVQLQQILRQQGSYGARTKG